MSFGKNWIVMIRSISNLAWQFEETMQAIRILKKYKIESIEIAPTMIVKDDTFSRINQDKFLTFKNFIENEGLRISSMQAILFGLNGSIFGTNIERRIILERFNRAIELSAMLDCEHIVFGSPKNRTNFETKKLTIAIDFFAEVESIASQHGVIIGIEGNSKLYGNTFLTNSTEVVEFVSRINSSYLRCNYDTGNEIMENQKLSNIKFVEKFVSQIQLSMPHLNQLDDQILDFLKLCDEENIFIPMSIEMLCNEIEKLEFTLMQLNTYIG